MFEINPIHIAYGVMIIGMMFCFIASRKKTKGVRSGADEFVFLFADISNYVSPNPPKEGLRVEKLGGGRVKPLPIEQQHHEIREIIKRANANKTVQLYSLLMDAESEMKEIAGKNKTYTAQFYAPIHQVFLMTHTFLNGCENLKTIDTEKKLEQFNSFLLNQVDHRMMLLKRISGDKADVYRRLNKVYAAEMEAREREEMEAKMKNITKN